MAYAATHPLGCASWAQYCISHTALLDCHAISITGAHKPLLFSFFPWQVFVATTNIGSGQSLTRTITYHPYSDGTGML